MSRPPLVAFLLIVSGGFMDAFTYIAYDHVFTNAQSGNVVLLAVHLARAEWADAAKHVPALLAFFPGILAGRVVLARRVFGDLPSDVAVLAIQFVILTAVGLCTAVAPASVVTAAIAFASAMQNTAFEKVDGIPYTSVVTTGNLRSFCEALHAGWLEGDVGARSKARILGPICAGFAAGALAGAAIVPLFGPLAVFCPVAVIAVAFVICLKTRASRRDADP